MSGYETRYSYTQDNTRKNQHGKNAHISLESMLKNMQERKYITGYRKIDTWAKPDDKGYRLYAPFVITLFNNERWALYSTTSYRSDRMKGTHWDCLLIKKYLSVSRCYLIIPNETEAQKANEDLQRCHGYDDDLDELDEAMTPSLLYNKIESLHSIHQPHGVREAVAGTNFETRITETLLNSDNRKLWNGQDLLIGFDYFIYERLLKKWNCPHDISDVQATTKIPLLQSKGKPKTDVLAIITYSDGSKHHFTISCKSSDSDYVSAHQYSSDAFIKALNIQEESLKEHIKLFEKLGGENKMRKLDDDLPEIFASELKPYITKLCEWVVSGKHGEYSSKDQIADYVLAYSKSDYNIKIYSSDEYIQKMLKESSGQFGTPFKWTYASKSLGKSIQLKMPTFKLKNPGDHAAAKNLYAK